MDKKYLSTVGTFLPVIVFAVFICCSQAISQPKESDKQTIITRVAHDWIKVGTRQYERGFYAQAKKSLLRALDYQNYLSVDDLNNINGLLAKVEAAGENQERVDELISRGRQLIAEGNLPQARVCYEEAKNIKGISGDKLKYVEETLKEIDEKMTQRRAAINKIYETSIKFYESGDYESARKGFLEVSREPLFISEKGKSPEEYLAEIDAILVQRIIFPPAPQEELNEVDIIVEESLLADVATPTYGDDSSAADVAKTVEAETRPVLTVRESYSRAVVKNAVDTAQKLTDEGKFYHAKQSVDSAHGVLAEHRGMIGEELYNHYSKQLKTLSEAITQGRERWVGETEGTSEQ